MTSSSVLGGDQWVSAPCGRQDSFGLMWEDKAIDDVRWGADTPHTKGGGAAGFEAPVKGSVCGGRGNSEAFSRQEPLCLIQG